MCSINIVFKKSLDLDRMIQKTKHRGLRTQKVVLGDKISLAHTRLPIQGLNRKFDGPFFRNGNYYLLNGEIYNYQDLGGPSVKSDVEVLNLSPRQFDGDFAIIKYNLHTKILEVFTDRFGKRQLYYKEKRGKIIGISSEIKALVTPKDSLNLYYLSTVGKFGYFFGQNQTLVKSIKRFMPGKKYLIQNQRIISKRKIAWNSSLLLPSNQKKELIPLIKLAIQRRLVSDVPIAILFSGGIDSSILLYHLKRLKQKLKIFTIENAEDLSYAQKYAKILGFPLKILPQKKLHNEARIHKDMELGADLGSVLLNYSLFRAIKKEGFRVCLTADTCDEIFSGYKRNFQFDFQQNDIFNEAIFYHFPRLDRSAMQHTLEYRTPFSADYVIDFALGLSYQKRIDKRILRKAYQRKIPHWILKRKKTPLRLERIEKNKKEERIKLINLWQKKLFNEFKND